MTLTQDPGSLFWCHTVVSLQVDHLSVEAVCETCERIVLLLVFITILGVLPHVTAECRHLGR